MNKPSADRSEVSPPVEIVHTLNSGCPMCRATSATTRSKTITDDTYWRCVACGHIWNLLRDRQKGPLRRSTFGSW